MYRPHCRICQDKLPFNRSLIISNDHRFCKEHYHHDNEQDDIIAQYQHTADTEWQHLRAQFTQK